MAGRALAVPAATVASGRAAASTRAAQAARAFELCFNRTATADETKDAAAFIEAEGLVQFARAMLNANEFVFVP